MNVEQARKNFETATAIRKEAERKLGDVHRLVNGAVEAEKAAESILLDIIANEPTEDKIIDMNHFVDSGLMVQFWNSSTHVHYGYLKGALTQDVYRYRNNNNDLYKYCSPKFNHDYASMIGWDKSPIPEGYEIEYIEFGDPFPFTTNDYNGERWDQISVFRIVGIKDKFKHE